MIIRADDITVERIDLTALDPSSGKIVDFKVTVRPLKLEIQGLESSMKKFFYNDITLGLPL